MQSLPHFLCLEAHNLAILTRSAKKFHRRVHRNMLFQIRTKDRDNFITWPLNGTRWTMFLCIFSLNLHVVVVEILSFNLFKVTGHGKSSVFIWCHTWIVCIGQLQQWLPQVMVTLNRCCHPRWCMHALLHCLERS